MPLFTQPPGPWMLPTGSTITAGTTIALTANAVYLIPVEVYGTCVVTGFRVRTVTATGTSDMGIYDLNGNLLAHTGVQSNAASTTNTFTLGTSLVLSPGRYILALCPSNGTDTYTQITAASTGLSDVYTATNTGTAGVLPSTTGTLVIASNRISMMALIQGGAP